MKNIFRVLMVLAFCVLITGVLSSMALAAAGAPSSQESAPSPTPTATPVSSESVFDQVIAITADGKVTTYTNVPGTAIPAPGPGGAVIVIDAKGAVTIITSEGVLWYDAGGNPHGY